MPVCLPHVRPTDWLSAFLLSSCHSFLDLLFLFICCGLLLYALLFNTQGEGSPDQGSWEKLDFIPEKYMGAVIGKNSKNIHKIEQKTGATLKVWGRNGLYIKGSLESQKRAIRDIKEQLVSLVSLSCYEGIRKPLWLNFAT